MSANTRQMILPGYSYCNQVAPPSIAEPVVSIGLPIGFEILASEAIRHSVRDELLTSEPDEFLTNEPEEISTSDPEEIRYNASHNKRKRIILIDEEGEGDEEEEEEEELQNPPLTKWISQAKADAVDKSERSVQEMRGYSRKTNTRAEGSGSGRVEAKGMTVKVISWRYLPPQVKWRCIPPPTDFAVSRAKAAEVRRTTTRCYRCKRVFTEEENQLRTNQPAEELQCRFCVLKSRQLRNPRLYLILLCAPWEFDRIRRRPQVFRMALCTAPVDWKDPWWVQKEYDVIRENPKPFLTAVEYAGFDANNKDDAVVLSYIAAFRKRLSV
jgi:hypothetical protein